MSDVLARSELGKASRQAAGYDPSLLFAVPREPAREALGIQPGKGLPFEGEDVWTAYELSWLDPRGKPLVAIGEIRIPSTSPNLVESKSLKLYLNGFNTERMQGADALRARVIVDLARATGADVRFTLLRADASAETREGQGESAVSLDGLDVAIEHFGPPRPELLAADDTTMLEESLVTDTFKSNCPVTGQPDFASIWIRYRGPRIDRAALLRYLVSYREHAALHEQCVEKIFCDITARCAPQALAVAARFTRRGGLDINPQRASHGYAVSWPARTPRQ